ncbi:hypothetical protein [Marinobacterium sedimentorum]|uniref:hypothetical protein n=1 Tax=Marinobacterium sedimentorum TaxID=2927804 RepID=UPI002795263F|nr:hypothetical protein [Marinobacterium sedimentorum]
MFQDIAAIPLIALLPLLSGVGAGETEGSGLVPVLRVLGSIAILVVGGRSLLRPVFRIVAKTGMQEVLAAPALLVVIRTAWLMDLAGRLAKPKSDPEAIPEDFRDIDADEPKVVIAGMGRMGRWSPAFCTRSVCLFWRPVSKAIHYYR